MVKRTREDRLKALKQSFFYGQVTRIDRQSGVQGLSLVTYDSHVTRSDICEWLSSPLHSINNVLIYTDIYAKRLHICKTLTYT